MKQIILTVALAIVLAGCKVTINNLPAAGDSGHITYVAINSNVSEHKRNQAEAVEPGQLQVKAREHDDAGGRFEIMNAVLGKEIGIDEIGNADNPESDILVICYFEGDKTDAGDGDLHYSESFESTGNTSQYTDNSVNVSTGGGNGIQPGNTRQQCAEDSSKEVCDVVVGTGNAPNVGNFGIDNEQSESMEVRKRKDPWDKERQNDSNKKYEPKSADRFMEI